MELALCLGLARDPRSSYQTMSKKAIVSQVNVPSGLFSSSYCCQLGYGTQFTLIELMCRFCDRCGPDKVRHGDGDEYAPHVDDKGGVEEYRWK